jgi:hypothetical protein
MVMSINDVVPNEEQRVELSSGPEAVADNGVVPVLGEKLLLRCRFKSIQRKRGGKFLDDLF